MPRTDGRWGTDLLERSRNGEADAADRLFELVYDDLRDLAGTRLNGDARRLTLQPTALVHEVYLKLMGADALDWKSQTHFRAIAARAMHQVLADHLRARGRDKRGGGWERVTLSGVEGSEDLPALELNDALGRLADVDQRAATVVILRFFGGLTEGSVAEHLGISERTVRNDWRMARAWLQTDLGLDGGAAS